MIEQYTEEILNAVKELLADETKSLESLKELIKNKLLLSNTEGFQDGINTAEADRATDAAGMDY